MGQHTEKRDLFVGHYSTLLRSIPITASANEGRKGEALPSFLCFHARTQLRMHMIANIAFDGSYYIVVLLAVMHPEMGQ